MLNDYYYSSKRQMLVQELDRDIVDLEDKDKDMFFVKAYIAFHDLESQRVFIQEQDDFDEEFLSFSVEEIPQLQEWYGLDDVSYQKLKKWF